VTSFGGPVAHIGFFRTEYVERRQWLDEQAFSELVAVTNLLPGPSSSQLGIAVGARRAGRLGAVAAWLGFTLPSAVAMTALALTVGSADVTSAGWVHGLELVAAPVVLLAVLAMRRSLAPDASRLAIAALAAAATLAIGGFAGQAAALAFGAAVGALAFRRPVGARTSSGVGRGRRIVALGCLVALGALLVGLPAIADGHDDHAVELADAMVRSGSLVFGGGHVVLPLLHQAVVEPGWVSEQEFLAGYGLAQAMPGPLFTFSAVGGAALALVAIFLPSFLLLGAVLPLWSATRHVSLVQAAFVGVSAAVVGLLAAALWDPVISSTINNVGDAAFALGLLGLLRALPAWAVVSIAAAAGQLLL
jgi:chromate transporter